MKECPTCGKRAAEDEARSLVVIDMKDAGTDESGERDTVRLVQALAIAISGKPMPEEEAVALAATLDAAPRILDPTEELMVPE